MTKEQLEAIFDRVRSWPAEKQAEAADALLWLEKNEEIYELTPDERADLEAALAEMDRGEVASLEDVAAVFARPR